MGKRIISQRRGRGSIRYRSPSFKFSGKISSLKEEGKVKDLINCPGHSAPLALIETKTGSVLIPANEGISVGNKVEFNVSAKAGNVMCLRDIPEGFPIFNIERNPNGKSKFARAGGTFARILNKLENGDVIVKMPSKKSVRLNGNCTASIGVAAGGGRKDKPFLKAGKKWHAMRIRGRLYPRTSAVAMNAIDHPFGSGRGRHLGKPSIAPRNAPPGRKVGQIRARRTGKKK